MLEKLNKELKKAKLDGFVTPSTDEFLNEFTPLHLNRLKTLTGFTGSFGMAIGNYLITDGRYLLQAKKEVDKSFTIIELREQQTGKLKGKKIGYDPKTIALKNLNLLKQIFGSDLNLIPTTNLVDKISQPKAPEIRAVFELPIKYAGMSSADKIKLIRQNFTGDSLLITNPDAICWLLNIRGYDVPYTPYLLAYLLIHKAGHPILFTDPKKVLHLANVKVQEFCELKNHLKGVIQFDPNKTPVWFGQNILNKLEKTDPVERIKAVKNSTEIKGFIDCHIEDGKAMVAFLKYLGKNWTNLDELTASQKLLEFRQKAKLFQYPSFKSISAFGSNGAIIHYHPTLLTCKKFKNNNLYLIDSGGQYLN
ncbi:MAG: aminopeptidase P family N-terminal domain-containing protein, partial [Sphingobacteriales bacterium]